MTLMSLGARRYPDPSNLDRADDRATPRALFDSLNGRYLFSVDVAASAENRLCDRYFDRQSNGLLQPWSGERVWCNPPYSALEPWVVKAWTEMRPSSSRQGAELVVMLLPANRCEQPFWQWWIEPYRDRPQSEVTGFVKGISLRTRFIEGRTRFARKGDQRGIWSQYTEERRPPFGCVLLFWERA